MAESLKTEIVIDSESHGLRLDVGLAHLLPQFSRSKLSEWIKSDLIRVNGHPAKPKDKLSCGDRLQIDVPLSLDDPDFKQAKPQAIPLDIVFEDESLIIVNKAAGLVVHPGAGNPDQTLVNALYHHCPALGQLPRAGIIHRLDKDTTGLLVIAKTLTAHTALVRQMAAREIERYYYALVQGQVSQSATISTGFGRHARNRIKMAVLQEGKPAITHYKPIESFQYFTLLQVKLQTGRTHQIRVHMEYIHHPIVGDPIYGKNIPLRAKTDPILTACLTAFTRQALHAGSLVLSHPVSGERLTFDAKMPDDFNNLLICLRQYEQLHSG